MPVTLAAVTKTIVDSPSQVNLHNDFIRLKEAVFLRRPILKEILEKRGAKNVFEYAQDYLDVNTNPIVIQRQAELIPTFREIVANQLDDAVAQSAAEQLKKYYFVSTADHHGPLCHPYFLNSNLVSSITCTTVSDPLLKNVIVLSCANISFSNSSFPRGILFNTRVAGKPKIQQLGFFPNSSTIRLSRVYNFPAYTSYEIAKVKKRLGELVSAREIAPEHGDVVGNILDEIYSQPAILECRYYSDQITKTNYLLWKKMLRHSGMTEPPNLIYIELEAIVINLLIKYHLFSDTTLHKILFDSDFQASFTKHFEGIEGGFSEKNNWGTWLFWALPTGAKYPKRLLKSGDELVSEDGLFRVALTPSAILEALKKRELFPSSQLSLLVVSLYYGLKCLGGFCQVNYLTQMREAYRLMLAEFDEAASLEACSRLQTKELGEDLSIAFLGETEKELSLATSIDLILYGNNQTWPGLMTEAKRITLAEALDPMMPEFYRVMYPDVQRDSRLMTITPGDIVKLNGLDKKIEPCVSF